MVLSDRLRSLTRCENRDLASAGVLCFAGVLEQVDEAQPRMAEESPACLRRRRSAALARQLLGRGIDPDHAHPFAYAGKTNQADLLAQCGLPSSSLYA